MSQHESITIFLLKVRHGTFGTSHSVSWDSILRENDKGEGNGEEERRERKKWERENFLLRLNECGNFCIN